jgi:hypothetical protein
MRNEAQRQWAAIALPGLLLAIMLTGDASRAENCTAPGCTIAEINLWSSEVVELIRGPINIDVLEAGNVTFGDPADILGVASGAPTEAVSLGDGGSVIVKFAEPIYDGPDFDFAVFENGIESGTPGLIYMELGFVEVSSDGVQFARFSSLTSRITAVAGLEEADPDDYDNLAGNRLAGTGTEFDLSELANHPLVLSGDVDIAGIRYVRIEDVIGDDSTSDSMGSPIFDPFPTSFITGGFDIDAVGAINVPEPGAQAGLICAALVLMGLKRRHVRIAR